MHYLYDTLLEDKGHRMATVQCPKCTTERKGFRRELDSWRHKLIHCVGFESILEGIYGPMLLRDLSLFNGGFFSELLLVKDSK
uniref:Uncharacterized protein n=1 Tax=Mastacembelus armatus TaxID=205130 RepID=A0A7N8YE40_9TELE